MALVGTKSGSSAELHEWLLSNRLGAFAMGCRDRCPERKYHGLLSVRDPTSDRILHLVAELHEDLELSGERYQLGVLRFGGTLHPRGDQLLEAFHVAPGRSDELSVSWSYRCGPVRLHRELRLDATATRLRLHYRSRVRPRARS